MLSAQLAQHSYPSLHLTDKAGFAMQLMSDYDVQHLPVLNDDTFVGTIAKEDLIDIDETITLAQSGIELIKASVQKEEFILAALKQMTEHEISVLPVLGDNRELIGTIAITALLQQLARYLGTNEPGGIVVLEVERRNFSFGEISRLVETNDAYITQLNTYTESDTGLVIVTIKVNKVEISDILATFQRYDYVVRYYFGEEQFANELKENYHHLMTYLNL